MRRVLLWLLPVVGIMLFLPWAIRDATLLTDFRGPGGIAGTRSVCTHNLATIHDLAQQVVTRHEAARNEEKSSDGDGWTRLARLDPQIAQLDCPLRHLRIDGYWQRRLPSPAPTEPYVVNPHVFSRPLREWKDTDVVAADSQPRHFADMRGPGIRCVFLVKWDGQMAQAYYDEHQQPSLIQQLADFARGVDGSDHEEAWRPYDTPPVLDLSRDYALLGIHVMTLLTMMVAWCFLLASARARPREADAGRDLD